MYDFIEFIPDSCENPIGFVSSDCIKKISASLSKNNLVSEPRIHLGYLPRRLDSVIVLYRDHEGLDFSSNHFKYGSLVARVLVLMAQSDGNIGEVEKNEIILLIKGLNFLNSSEKNALVAKVICLTEEMPSLKMNYYDYAIDKILGLSTKSQQLIIDLVKSVIVCDGYIDNSEVKFLRDIYVSLDMPTNRLKSDLTSYAKLKKVDLRDYKDTEIDILFEDDVDLSDLDVDIEDILHDIDDS